MEQKVLAPNFIKTGTGATTATTTTIATATTATNTTITGKAVSTATGTTTTIGTTTASCTGTTTTDKKDTHSATQTNTASPIVFMCDESFNAIMTGFLKFLRVPKVTPKMVKQDYWKRYHRQRNILY